MAFDAGMLFAVVHELDRVLGENNGMGGSKIEKIYMPDRDEIHLMLRTRTDTHRLVLSASASCARITLSDVQKENPQTPPMLCMLLRKKLMGARVVAVRQYGFERACEVEFDTKDEMGFSSKKYLVAEIMGKHSNIIFCDSERKILGALRTVDATSDFTRRIIPGIRYELPPAQDKSDPTLVTKDEFFKNLSAVDESTPLDKVLLSSYFGMAPLVCREIAYRATGDLASLLATSSKERLWEEFSRYFKALSDADFSPTLLFENDAPSAFEYSIYPILQYGDGVRHVVCEGVCRLIDSFFSIRDKNDRIRQRSTDIHRLLTNAKNRLVKKIETQKGEIAASADMDECRRAADLITQEMYRVKRGDTSLEALDYSKEPYESVVIELDEKLSPSQNAQRYYKKYNRKKTALATLTEQIEVSKKELLYIDTVFDALSRAETEKDLAEIREELSLWGYMKKDAKKLRLAEKKQSPKPLMLTSPSGYEIYVGRNNLQNDFVTTKLSEKNDWWFHVKNYAGSHVLLKVQNRDEPPAEDFTFACEVAAKYSSAMGERVEVDYTQIRYIKKPPSSKPGFVTYSTYWSATVDSQK